MENNIDEIIGKQTNNKPFDKNAWKEMKIQERNNAFELIDKTTTDIIKDHDKFKSYIDVQSRFDKYSVGNALLIYAQKPTATIIKDFENWKKEIGESFRINGKEKGIVIIEPGDTYAREDGTQAQSYNTKRVFDISQTNVKDNQKENSYDEKLLLKALIHECPVKMQIVDNLESNKVANWNKEDNTLYVCRNTDTAVVFNAIAKELAKANENENSGIELREFKSNCIAYMISKKYGIDVSNVEIGDIPNSLMTLEPKQIRNELVSMRDTMEDMNNRMSQYFESISKTQKNKDMER